MVRACHSWKTMNPINDKRPTSRAAISFCISCYLDKLVWCSSVWCAARSSRDWIDHDDPAWQQMNIEIALAPWHFPMSRHVQTQEVQCNKDQKERRWFRNIASVRWSCDLQSVDLKSIQGQQFMCPIEPSIKGRKGEIKVSKVSGDVLCVVCSIPSRLL